MLMKLGRQEALHSLELNHFDALALGGTGDILPQPLLSSGDFERCFCHGRILDFGIGSFGIEQAARLRMLVLEQHALGSSDQRAISYAGRLAKTHKMPSGSPER